MHLFALDVPTDYRLEKPRVKRGLFIPVFSHNTITFTSVKILLLYKRHKKNPNPIIIKEIL